MAKRRMRVVVGLVVTVLLMSACWGRQQFDTQIKTVAVVDANGVPIPGLSVYQRGCLVWDNQRQTVRPAGKVPWQKTDANGEFSFEFLRQGAGRNYYIMDPSFERMAVLHIERQDPAERYTTRLEKLARIKGVLKSEGTPFSKLHVDLHYLQRHGSYPLLSADYEFNHPTSELPIDFLCPPGCSFYLEVQPREYQMKKEIAPLRPGEVFDLGTVDFRVASGLNVAGKPAPKLQVAEWIKGEPVTLEELKGKVVLLYFWGWWSPPSNRAIPRFAELQKKYGDDGLVVLAVHDASGDKTSLLDQDQQMVDLSDVPFRVAIDTAPEGSGGMDTQSKGVTISDYGVTRIPTVLLIDREGNVCSGSGSEEQLHMLLYGRPMSKPTTLLGRLMASHRSLFVTMGVGLGLISILALVLVGLRLRRSRPKPRPS